jgi:hypothetical protein
MGSALEFRPLTQHFQLRAVGKAPIAFSTRGLVKNVNPPELEIPDVAGDDDQRVFRSPSWMVTARSRFRSSSEVRRPS